MRQYPAGCQHTHREDGPHAGGPHAETTTLPFQPPELRAAWEMGREIELLQLLQLA